MAGLSDVAENKLLDHIFGDPAWTITAPVYLALLVSTTGLETETGAGITSNAKEASYTGYSRTAIAAADMAAASGGSKTNSNPITCAGCSGGSAQNIVGFAICTASSGGDIIAWGTLPTVTVSPTQTPPTIAAGALTVTAD